MELLFPLLIFAAMYFFLLRPQRQRAKAHESLIGALKVGDEVVTIGGVLGTIVALHDRNVEIEVSDGVRLHVVRPAISGIVPDVPEVAAGEQPPEVGSSGDPE